MVLIRQFLDGMMGSFLGQFSLVVATTALISLLVSFTIIPLLTSRYGKLEVLSTNNIFGKFIKWFENMLDTFGLQMKNLLNWSLKHKLVTFGVTVLLFVSSIMLVTGGFIGTEMLDTGDRGAFFIRFKLPKDATVEQTNQIALQAEEIMKQQPLITSLFTTVGVEED
ncbi:MAG: efflux RND transporter permease subunit [Bacteroidales bacterium]|jgi:HAE1 family hydrophobic/amphiphilic exporter-1|nr:efflux RND transporter permease subunit [Bacteroidales bacterium]